MEAERKGLTAVCLWFPWVLAQVWPEWAPVFLSDPATPKTAHSHYPIKYENKLGWFSSTEILAIAQQIVPPTQKCFLVFRWPMLPSLASPSACLPRLLYMTSLCGLCGLLPLFVIWPRLWVTITTVTVLKEARPRLRGHPNPWQFISLGQCMK